MVFSSPVFLFAFLPVTYLVALCLPGTRARNVWLAVMSVVFYTFGRIDYVPLFLGSVLANYLAGLALSRCKRGRRGILTVATAVNLALLGVWKYAGFLTETFNSITGAGLPVPQLALPIGISFFTFQGMSYVFDVYRDPDAGTRDPGKLLLYVSFFPQLVAGPIVKYHDIAPQIEARRMTAEGAERGLRRLSAGLGKKVLIANVMGRIADRLFAGPAGEDTRLAWLAAVCYALQIYFDFSGYSDMAVGMGGMFGFTLPENFRSPYAAASLRDFWRRWHITLSDWFREYVYIPLGGNRRGKARTALNRMIVFLCTGIWHGANWTFVLWGVLHGLVCCAEDAGILPAERLQRTRAGRLAGRALTLLTVTVLFVLFRADSVSAAADVIGAMFLPRLSAGGGALAKELLSPAAILTGLAALLLAGKLPERVRARLRGESAAAQIAVNALCVGILVLSVCSMAGSGYNPFIYFQF